MWFFVLEREAYTEAVKKRIYLVDNLRKILDMPQGAAGEIEGNKA